VKIGDGSIQYGFRLILQHSSPSSRCVKIGRLNKALADRRSGQSTAAAATSTENFPSEGTNQIIHCGQHLTDSLKGSVDHTAVTPIN
jgi:hypothetical protein